MTCRRRRHLFAALIYAAVVLAVLATAAPRTLSEHTPFNHFALLAESWLEGRLHLGGPPPAYAGNNDFAWFQGRHYVVFPPVPALLVAPFVAISGTAEGFRDGLFFLLLSGVGPAVLFLALEKLRRVRESQRSERDNIALALLFAFGSVYFFTAVQGTVWFAAHVIAVGFAAAYLRFSIRGERPLLAGLALGLGFATRTPLLFATPLFIAEAVRAAALGSAPCPWRDPTGYARSIDRRALAKSLSWFLLPIVLISLALCLHNQARFGDPFEFGYRYLTVVWQERIEKWGLFSYHYLARNLGVILTSLPWLPAEPGVPFKVNHHGLALWVTTPLYVLLLWPKRRVPSQTALWVSVLGAALPSLFYQNTGWVQFGYRFSNDYAVFLFALFALSGWSLRRGVLALASWALIVNTFGAWTFARPEHRHFYFTDPTQRILYQPD